MFIHSGMLKFLLWILYLIGSIRSQFLNLTNYSNSIKQTQSPLLLLATMLSTTTHIRLKRPLASNFTRKIGDRLRLECEFELLQSSDEPLILPNDLNIYWVKNYQELLKTRKGQVLVLRKNLNTSLILKKLQEFDSGSYMCIAEITTPSNQFLNSSSETTLFINSANNQNKKGSKYFKSKQDLSDYIFSNSVSNVQNDLDNDEDDAPYLNPTIVENLDDKGFCEPYKGTVCVSIISSNHSIYSTTANQQDIIEERLRTIIPLLLSKENNLSKKCSTFAIPSLCLFAFPLCDKETKQPKQICRHDCQQLQDDICKNEYFNVKSLFENKISDNLQQASNFLLDCNQLPPSSDSQNNCLQIIKMTLNKIESQAIDNQRNYDSINNDVTLIKPKSNSNLITIKSFQDECIRSNGVDYQGTQSFTRNGYQCQKWSNQYSHENNFQNIKEPIDHNYCRNPDNDVEPWCYIKNPQKHKDYCNIPKCTISEIGQNSSASSDPKLNNFMFIMVPSISILILLLLMLSIYCYCRRPNSSVNDTKALSLNNNNLVSTTVNSNGQTALIQHQPSLKISNGSISKKNITNKPNCRASSSKSSVASTTNNNQSKKLNTNYHNSNLEQNPFLKPNYDNQPLYNYNNQEFLFNQHQQQFNQFQSQCLQNDLNYSVKQITRSNIRLLQEIGKGRFGSLFTGELIGSYTPNSVIKVTVKTLNKKIAILKNRNLLDRFNEDNATSTQNINVLDSPASCAAAHFAEQEFYNEISLYSSLRNRNLANLIGVYTTDMSKNEDSQENDDDCSSMLTDNGQQSVMPQCMIFEHLNFGDLHEYLIQKAGSGSSIIYNGMLCGSQSNLSAVSSIGGASSNYLNVQQQQRIIADFLYIGQQIASGMEYLSSQNFVLKDLATRNILMSDNLTIKISIDLIAQYKEMYYKDYYKFQGKNMPVRWMSPESLLYGRYTQQSDVWSYGVCLWEIFNYGCQPYSGCTNPEAIEMIRDRQLLLIPDDCPQRAYTLMLECWHEIPMQRPTFTDILSRLRNWENYYIFNNQTNNNQLLPSSINSFSNGMQSLPPLPLPIHLQHNQQPQQNSVQIFPMSSSYSSNSQNSKTSSFLGNTASTGISSCSPPPPPLPPPLQMTQHQMNASLVATSNCYSPSKNITNLTVSAVSNNLFGSKFNVQQKPSPPSSIITSTNQSNGTRIYRDLDATNSLRMSQRNFNCNIPSFNMNTNNSHIPNGQLENHQFEL